MGDSNALSVDTVVIGAGIAGLATAYELANEGQTVAIVDKDVPGSHQSNQNWGFVRQQGRGIAELPMMKMSNELWRNLSDELEADIAWTKGGNLAVFESASQEEGYRAWLEVGRQNGVDVKLLAETEIRDILPGWRRQCRGALFARDDGHAEPSLVTTAYVNALERLNVKVFWGRKADEILTHGSRVRGVRVGSTHITSSWVVCAAGAWSRALLSEIGISLPQNYVHGTVGLTSPIHSVTDATVWGPGYSFRQRRDGRFICTMGGGGIVDVDLDAISQAKLYFGAFKANWRRFHLRPGHRVPREIKSILKRRKIRSVGPPNPRAISNQPSRALNLLKGAVDGLDSLQIDKSWSGIIDSTPDALPVIDSDVEYAGLVIATGFSGHGFGLGPAVGKTVREMITSSHTTIDVSSMRSSRFSEGKYARADAIL